MLKLRNGFWVGRDKTQGTARKMSSDEAKGMTAKHFLMSQKNQNWYFRVLLLSQKKKAIQNFKKIKGMSHRSPQQLGSLRSTGLIKKAFVGMALSNGINPNETHRSPTKSLRVLCQQKHYQLVLKGTEIVQNEEITGPPKFYEKTAQLQTHCSFHGKGRRRRQNQESERQSQEPRRTTAVLWDLIKESVCTSMGSYRSVTPLCFPVSPSCTGMCAVLPGVC